ncbi:MAG: hypothetical protein QW469_00335 [Candidatus Aenigmatarchaeota archaeon]
MNLNLFRKYLFSQNFEMKLNNRIERLQRAENNPVERASIYLECQDDVFTFIDLFGVVLEPRLPESPDVPFFLFDYQRELIYRILEAEEKGEDLLIEKTRDMGVTWTIIWYMIWRWLFKDRWYALIGSRKEEEVDNKTPQSLFGKIRYAYYSLPKWIRPAKFRKSDHDIHLKFINPDRMGMIEGESANPYFGRGKRASFLYMDELFFWKFVRESWRSSTDVSPCRIAVSTAYPTSFARALRESFANQNKLITLDWRSHPLKDEEWYQNELKRREVDPLSVESELEIKYTIDPTLAYYPEVQNCPIEDFDYNSDLPLYIGLDFAVRDNSAIVYVQRDKNFIYFLDVYQNNNKPLHFYYPFLKQGFDFTKQPTFEVVNKFTNEKFVLDRKNYSQSDIEFIARFNKWKSPVFYAGEVAHRQKMFKSNTSIAQELAGIGIYLRVNPNAITHPIRRNAVKKILPISKFSSKYNASEIYDALLFSHYPKISDTTIEPKDKPVHDEYADIRAAVENFACNITSTGQIKEFVYKKI